MAGPFDFDVDTQITDDLARAWDDLDNEAAAGGATLALSPATVVVTASAVASSPGGVSPALTPATVAVAAQTVARTLGTTSLALAPASVPVAGQALGISQGAIADPPSLAVSMAGSTATLTWSASPTGGVSTYDVFYRTPSTLAVFTPGTDTALTTGTTSPYVHSSLASGSHDWQVFGVVSAWSPLSLPNLVGWWDASDTATITASANAVSQWNDKSGNGKHLTQGTGANQPLTATDTINSLNVLKFDSTDLMTVTFALSAPFTLLVVFKASDNTGVKAILYGAGNDYTVYTVSGSHYYKAGGSPGSSTTANTNTRQIVASVASGANSNAYIGGTQFSTNQDVGSSTFTTLRISNGFIGDIAEVAAMSSGITSGDRTAWNTYCAKWGI